MIPAYSQPKPLSVEQLLGIQKIYSVWSGGSNSDIPQNKQAYLSVPSGASRYPVLVLAVNMPTRITGLRYQSANGFNVGISFHVDTGPAISGRYADQVNGGVSGDVIYPASILEEVYPTSLFTSATSSNVSFLGKNQRIYAQVGGNQAPITIMDIDLDVVAYQYFTVFGFNTTSTAIALQVSVSYVLNVGSVNG